MKIKVLLGKQRVVENEGHDAHVLVRLLAPAPAAEGQRPPLAVLPIVDVSGSMAGSKLAAVKRSLARLIDHLVVGDHVGLVSFSDDAQVVLPVTEVTEASRRRLRQAVSRLEDDASTNLADGFLTGCRAMAAASLPSSLRSRLILLTDGLANRGPATSRNELCALVREHLGSSSLSAFGFGDDCDHSVLADLAEEGRGSFAFIQNEDGVLTAFARELGGLVSTYAADVRIRIVPVAGAPIEEKLGDLLHQGELPLCVPLALPRHAAATQVEVARVEVTYRDTSGRDQQASAPVLVDYVPAGQEDRDFDPLVLQARDERLLRDAQDTAEAHAQRGDFAAAHRAIENVIGRLASPKLAAFARTELLPSYEHHGRYADTAGLRAEAKMALKKRRILNAQAAVAESLDVQASPAEVLMEQSFRKAER